MVVANNDLGACLVPAFKSSLGRRKMTAAIGRGTGKNRPRLAGAAPNRSYNRHNRQGRMIDEEMNDEG
jgi:hypothetical protein